MTTTASTSTAIAARPEQVWQLLTDAEWWNDADNGVVGIDGPVVEGRRITLVSEHDRRGGFDLHVTQMCAPLSMLWTGGMPLKLCTGRRSFEIEASGDDCTYSMVEDVTGPLSRLVIRVLPDLQHAFDRFAAALRADSEASARAHRALTEAADLAAARSVRSSAPPPALTGSEIRPYLPRDA